MRKSDKRTLNRFESLPNPVFPRFRLWKLMIQECFFIFRWSIGVNLGFLWSLLWNWRNNCFIWWLMWRSLTSESQYSWRTIKFINFEYISSRMTFLSKSFLRSSKRSNLKSVPDRRFHSQSAILTFDQLIMTRHCLYWPYSSKFDIWKIYKSYHFQWFS